jgi:galactokinase
LSKIRVSAPGRICLFGEHQDYLKLAVITAAIDLRIAVSGQQRSDRIINLDLPDISSREKIELPHSTKQIKYEKKRDYFKSVINLLLREGLALNHGYDCEVHSTIPINSGTSSSSALTVAWTRFLLEDIAADRKPYTDPAYIAHLAYLAEVEEFGEPGGMMDHYVTALGDVQYIEFTDNVSTTKLKEKLGTFVLGDSLEPKDTTEILQRVKFGVLNAINQIHKIDPHFNLIDCTVDNIEKHRGRINQDQIDVLEGAILNRNITQQARICFDKNSIDDKEFGKLLSEHHEILDKKLKISTPKINRMIRQALDAGAYGGKINGSGGGGCMFVYAPENSDKVVRTIEQCGGKAYIVKVDKGLTTELI